MSTTALADAPYGIRVGETLPSFALPAADGRLVRRWDYYARASLLVLVLHGPACSRCRALLATVAARGAVWDAAEAQPLAVLRATPIELADLARTLPISPSQRLVLLADDDGALRRTLVGAYPGVVALVADRYGKVRHRVSAADGDGLDVADLAAWMDFLALQCAE